MKSTSKRLPLLVVFCLNLIAITPIFAGNPGKPKPPAKPQPPSPGPQEVMKKYDLDHNKIINLSEAEAIQKAYKANPQDPLLKKYDIDKNGELSDAEIMKISPPKAPPAKPKAGNPKKGKKK